MNAWRTRQFDYTWLQTLAHRYEDFWRTTENALAYAASSLSLDVGRAERSRLMAAYLTLKAWPDAPPVLQALRKAGLRMAFLSNFTTHMLDAAVNNAGLKGYFESHLSTDRVKAYKPDPRAYRWRSTPSSSSARRSPSSRQQTALLERSGISISGTLHEFCGPLE